MNQQQPPHQSRSIAAALRLLLPGELNNSNNTSNPSATATTASAASAAPASAIVLNELSTTATAAATATVIHYSRKLSRNNSKSKSRHNNSNNPSRSLRAGINFPVGLVNRALKSGHYSDRVGGGAPVYIAAVLEYLTTEILDLAAIKAKQKLSNSNNSNNSITIVPADLDEAVSTDPELATVRELINQQKHQSQSQHQQQQQHPQPHPQSQSQSQPQPQSQSQSQSQSSLNKSSNTYSSLPPLSTIIPPNYNRIQSQTLPIVQSKSSLIPLTSYISEQQQQPIQH